MADAIRAQELRKAERDAKTARELAEKQARQLAIDARDKAFHEQEKLNRQIERLKLDLAKEKAELAKLAETRKAAEAEKTFLQDYVRKAQANTQALQTLLTKLNTPPPAPAAPAK
jgi:predicted phage gp36 major capsid-like protein